MKWPGLQDIAWNDSEAALWCALIGYASRYRRGRTAMVSRGLRLSSQAPSQEVRGALAMTSEGCKPRQAGFIDIIETHPESIRWWASARDMSRNKVATRATR